VSGRTPWSRTFLRHSCDSVQGTGGRETGAGRLPKNSARGIVQRNGLTGRLHQVACTIWQAGAARSRLGAAGLDALETASSRLSFGRFGLYGRQQRMSRTRSSGIGGAGRNDGPGSPHQMHTRPGSGPSKNCFSCLEAPPPFGEVAASGAASYRTPSQINRPSLSCDHA